MNKVEIKATHMLAENGIVPQDIANHLGMHMVEIQLMVQLLEELEKH
ncbi:hypothetical protein [Bacillus thuringiensis]|nr:hypothetical protein [Bacillus thuringiensis]